MISNNIRWMDFNLLQIEQLNDRVEKEYNLKMRKRFLKSTVSPLLSGLPLHTGFKFSNHDDYLTCRMMLEELISEYHKRDYTKEEIFDILQGKRVKKR